MAAVAAAVYQRQAFIWVQYVYRTVRGWYTLGPEVYNYPRHNHIYIEYKGSQITKHKEKVNLSCACIVRVAGVPARAAVQHGSKGLRFSQVACAIILKRIFNVKCIHITHRRTYYSPWFGRYIPTKKTREHSTDYGPAHI